MVSRLPSRGDAGSVLLAPDLPPDRRALAAHRPADFEAIAGAYAAGRRALRSPG